MYKITYTSHKIPNVASCSLYQNKIYYLNDGSIYLYNIENHSSFKLLSCNNSAKIFMHKSTLCTVYANIFTEYRQLENGLEKIRSTTLSDIPCRIVTTEEGIVFIYSDSVDLYTNRIHKLQIRRIKDLCFVKEDTFILMENNKVFKVKNIFHTHSINLNRSIKMFPEPSVIYTNIHADENSIILRSTDLVEKYEINPTYLMFEYSFKCSGQVYENILCGDNTVLLGKAPYLLFNDKIYCFSNGAGISAGRVYFIEKEEQHNYETTEYIGPTLTTTSINPNNVSIPDYITDYKIIQKYINFQIEVEKYSIVCDNVKKISAEFKTREDELEKLISKIDSEQNYLNRRVEEIRKRMELIKERASRIKVGKEVNEFYDNIKTLRTLLNKMEAKEISDFKLQLKAQRLALQSKLNK